ncbi:sulfurtransferase TusA family protein [Clostridium magnum]|uniref:SirA-like protein n=1 Tax=Clostridium magnum DSM 2767 TaxID=1121326 RepID=A0A168DX84_9CLOT|nr:sulfurtransferase TusA family protein [Clostridium magnum]KZL91579.1 SirA-like protein [Clostridium magnum DSM 2767]SHH48332.1 TusA-related sulfurtransferase [Clostridium magnum DSM 2767]
MKQFDARGLSCPQPVLETKKALAENPSGVQIFVDNTTAKNNVERFMKNSGYKVEVEERNGDFLLTARQ